MTGKKKSTFSLFEYFFELVAWCLIVLSPLLISAIIAFFVYNSIHGFWGLTLVFLLLIAGLLVGIIWANRAWRKSGTMAFLSRLSATPELDEPEKRNQKEDL